MFKNLGKYTIRLFIASILAQIISIPITLSAAMLTESNEPDLSEEMTELRIMQYQRFFPRIMFVIVTTAIMNKFPIKEN